MNAVSVHLQACPRGTVLPLARAISLPSGPAHGMQARPLPDCAAGWRAGTELFSEDGVRLRVVGRALLTVPGEMHICSCPLLEALDDIPEGERLLHADRTGWSLGWITLSDKGAVGQRRDESGPLMAELTQKALPITYSRGFLLPDDPQALRGLVMELALGHGYDLILTNGGTGLSPRDTTPEALAPLLERRLPGFEQTMTLASLKQTPMAALSRAVAGTIGRSIVISLPGSRKAVSENLQAILPVLGHALNKLHGDASDCGGETTAVQTK